MTAPRQILPGTTYLVTRRCTHRQFLLTPSRVTNQNVEYCLALAAERTGVLVHAACVMSNHWHGVVTDPEARLPEFLETFHKLLAKAQNTALDRCENLWSSDKPSVVVLVSEQDVLDKMAYTIANPTLAGLVKTPSEWPGVISQKFGGQYSVEMPDVFFDADGHMPDSATLEFSRPPIFASLTDDALNVVLRDAVAKLVRGARDELHRLGLSFVGRRAVLQQHFETTPRVNAPRRVLNPRVAAKAPAARVSALRGLLAFVNAYRAAWEGRRAGNHGVVFPAGTYALRIFAGVACALAPPG